MERKVLHMGAAAIVFALVLRLLSGGLGVLHTPEAASWILFLTTGRMVRTETVTPPSAPAPENLPLRFEAADEARVEVVNYTGYSLDISQMLHQPLSWDLTQGDPAVLILHSHGSESYENTENYEESGLYRTLDNRYNMVSIGARVGELLEEAGIGTVRDQTLHDYPSYSGSYENSRASMEEYLEQYPSIRLVLDLHRDAAEDENGNQLRYTVDTPWGESARLMIVVGSPAGGQDHPNWRENMALAVKLQAQLEKMCPGITYETRLRTSRFNQDLSPGALLVEVGAAGNTRQDALVASQILAEALIALARGTA